MTMSGMENLFLPNALLTLNGSITPMRMKAIPSIQNGAPMPLAPTVQNNPNTIATIEVIVFMADGARPGLTRLIHSPS